MPVFSIFLLVAEDLLSFTFGVKIRANLAGLRNAAKKAVQSGRLSECLENSPFILSGVSLVTNSVYKLHPMPIFCATVLY